MDRQSSTRIPDPRLLWFNILVRHAKNVLPNLQDIVLLEEVEGSRTGIVVGYIRDGDTPMPIVIGAIDQSGNAWTTFSALPMYAIGRPDEDNSGTIPTRVLRPPA